MFSVGQTTIDIWI